MSRLSRLVEGQWWSTADTHPQVSIEQGISERLNIKLGESLLSP